MRKLTQRAQRALRLFSPRTQRTQREIGRLVHAERTEVTENRNALRSFTLIELLTVIAIIAVLAGLTVGGASYARKKARISRAQAEIASLEGALENYKIDKGVYVLSTTLRGDAANNCTNLYAALAGGPKKYMTFKSSQLNAVSATATNVLDPFGNPYNYYCNPGAADQTNTVTFDLWSYGQNGTNDEGTADDITNWH